MHWSSFMIIGFGNNFKERTMSKTGIDILQGRSKLSFGVEEFWRQNRGAFILSNTCDGNFCKMINK